MPVNLNGDIMIQGKIALPVYDYVDREYKKFLDMDLWMISGEEVSNAVGTRGELEIKLFLDLFKG
jgi:hypothetical protein